MSSNCWQQDVIDVGMFSDAGIHESLYLERPNLRLLYRIIEWGFFYFFTVQNGYNMPKFEKKSMPLKAPQQFLVKLTC